ncbi:MAG: extracellular solute-binding protein [Chloroflexi bacterium]|nr:extracellular solute-binding protein [Chloroflexota bacterium]
MRRILCMLVAAVIVGSIVAGCTASPQPPVAPAGGGANQNWQAEWQKLVEAGKREGTVSVYTTWLPEIRAALTERFKQNYGISLEFATVSGGQELAAKMEKERTAGLYLADVIGTALSITTTVMKPIGIVAPLEPMLILPEARDTRAQLAGRLFLDAEQKYFVPLTASYDPFLSRNTELVKEGELKSYYDVLDPKWRGKIMMNDPTHIGGGNNLVTLLTKQWGEDKTRDFLRQLVKQEPALSRDYRLQAEWVAKGKVAVGVGVPTSQIRTFQKVGAPVAFVRPKEGGLVTQGGPGGMTLPAGKLPHPNAARVFINWLLTKEGETVFSKAFLQPAWRLDVPTEGLEELVPPPGAVIEDDEFDSGLASRRDLAKEIFAPLLAR